MMLVVANTVMVICLVISIAAISRAIYHQWGSRGTLRGLLVWTLIGFVTGALLLASAGLSGQVLGLRLHHNQGVLGEPKADRPTSPTPP